MTIETPGDGLLHSEPAGWAPTGAAMTRRAWLRAATGLAASSIVAWTGTAPVLAQVSTTEYGAWVTAFRAQALARGVSARTYDRVMAKVVPETSVYKYDKAQPEFQEPVWRYINRRVNEWRINTGRERVKQYADLFARIEKTYGVDRYVLCALWGMESAFGEVVIDKKYMKPVINCLAALAWGEPRRRTYWEAELINALLIVDRGWAEPEDMIGSWAGAMGHTQWMPEVWLNMGVDFDGDGKVYPFGKPDDSLAGTARYMVARGKYRAGEAWGYEVRLASSFNVSAADGKTKRTVADWEAMGLARASGDAFPRPADPARVYLPAGINGPGFLLLQNFAAIKSYNPSFKYALAIGHLADRMRGGGPFIQPWPVIERPLSLDELQEIQVKLTAAGFDTGGVDGRTGEKTQAAIQAWQKSVGMSPADGYPTDKVLIKLRGG